MLSILRWLLPSVVPAALVLVVIHKSDKDREPPWLVALTFVLGALFAGVGFFLEHKAAMWSGLDVRTSIAGEAGALLFLFAILAPIREAAKVAAVWPAFRSRHFDEPYDGIVYASASALGFAAWENVVMLRANPDGGIWIARAFISLPAHLFFAAMWGYALGRAKKSKRVGAIFAPSWLAAMLAHALYIHFVYGRGPGALVAVLPLLLTMGGVAFVAARDLRLRGDAPPSSIQASSSRLAALGLDGLSNPPSMRAMRDALRRSNQPLGLRWVFYGSIVTIGAMVTFVGIAIAFGFAAHVDFSIVDEHDVATTAPVALLGAGLLAAFPVSGYLIARASNVSSLLEPALATGLALLLTLLVLGLAAPVSVVFAVALSPVAFGLACAGAWVGKPSH